MTHPRDVLLGAAIAAPLPVCDHYCGVPERMRKSLALQAEMTQEFGACVFDVTLDCEDGAPVGAERGHASMVAELANAAVAASAKLAHLPLARVAARLHPLDHPAFEDDVAIIVGAAGAVLCHLMLPKVQALGDVVRALAIIDRALPLSVRAQPLPVHVLVESPAAVQQVAAIAAHPRVQSVSFGLMDFVSAHGGAIPAQAMRTAAPGAADACDQFSHPLVVRAKLEISAACHAAGKVPAHCVVTEFNNPAVVAMAARRASQSLGFTRMWSIHPQQIRPILAAFAPALHEIEQASRIICAAQRLGWAPMSLDGHLHDRASYRYFWHLLERAHQTAQLPADDPAQMYFAH